MPLLREVALLFAEDKIRFVKEKYPNSEVSQKAVLSTLMLMDDYELKRGEDFSQFDLDFLQQCYNEITVKNATASHFGTSNILQRMKLYVKWRKLNGLKCTDNIERVVIDRDESIRSSMVSSPRDLKRALDIIFDDPVLGTSDVIYRVFLWMAFAGMNDIDAVRVTKYDIEFEAMIIRYNHVDYPVYDDSRYDFRIACDITEFREKSGKHGRYRKRLTGDEIMRGTANIRFLSPEDSLVKTIRPTLANMVRAAKNKVASSDDRPANPVALDLTYNKVKTSGLFFRWHERERLGVSPDFQSYIRNSHSGNMESKKNSSSSNFMRSCRAIESDYNNWKKAFHF